MEVSFKGLDEYLRDKSFPFFLIILSAVLLIVSLRSGLELANEFFLTFIYSVLANQLIIVRKHEDLTVLGNKIKFDDDRKAGEIYRAFLTIWHIVFSLLTLVWLLSILLLRVRPLETLFSSPIHQATFGLLIFFSFVLLTIRINIAEHLIGTYRR